MAGVLSGANWLAEMEAHDEEILADREQPGRTGRELLHRDPHREPGALNGGNPASADPCIHPWLG
jgi:hypothetical protein